MIERGKWFNNVDRYQHFLDGTVDYFSANQLNSTEEVKQCTWQQLCGLEGVSADILLNIYWVFTRVNIKLEDNERGGERFYNLVEYLNLGLITPSDIYHVLSQEIETSDFIESIMKKSGEILNIKREAYDNDKNLLYVCNVKDCICRFGGQIIRVDNELREYEGWVVIYEDARNHKIIVAELTGCFKCVDEDLSDSLRSHAFIFTEDLSVTSFRSGTWLPSEFVNLLIEEVVGHPVWREPNRYVFIDRKFIEDNDPMRRKVEEQRDYEMLPEYDESIDFPLEYNFYDLYNNCEREGKKLGVYCDVNNGVCLLADDISIFVPELFGDSGRVFVVIDFATGEYKYKVDDESCTLMDDIKTAGKLLLTDHKLSGFTENQACIPACIDFSMCDYAYIKYYYV